MARLDRAVVRIPAPALPDHGGDAPAAPGLAPAARRPRRRGQASLSRWLRFLRGHAEQTWACDFLTVTTLGFETLHAFLVLRHDTREIVHVAVTRAPTDAWVAAQLERACAGRAPPRFLVRDRDRKYGPRFRAAARALLIRELRTPYRTPVANSLCERAIGSARRELLDHVLVFSVSSLERHLLAWVRYYNHLRPHQGLGQRIPAELRAPRPRGEGPIRVWPALGGLVHVYARDAA